MQRTIFDIFSPANWLARDENLSMGVRTFDIRQSTHTWSKPIWWPFHWRNNDRETVFTMKWGCGNWKTTVLSTVGKFASNTNIRSCSRWSVVHTYTYEYIVCVNIRWRREGNILVHINTHTYTPLYTFVWNVEPGITYGDEDVLPCSECFLFRSLRSIMYR